MMYAYHSINYEPTDRLMMMMMIVMIITMMMFTIKQYVDYQKSGLKIIDIA